MTEEDLRQGRVRVPVYKAYYVDQILRESDETLTVQRELFRQVFFQSAYVDAATFYQGRQQLGAKCQFVPAVAARA